MQEFSTTEALVVLTRSLKYALPIWHRYVVKIVLATLALSPPLILIWPLKIIIDNVINGHQLAQTTTQYPFYIRPLVDMLVGQSTLTIVFSMMAVGIATVFVLGAYGTGQGQRDGVTGNLNEGFDTATRTENDVNRATSAMGGILGYFEYLWTIRISHVLNYRLRNQVFNHIQKLPMSSLENRTIGDSVYRVMYDTAAISPLCEEVIVTPVRWILQIVLTFYLLNFSFSKAPELVWIALSAFPLWFIAFQFLTKPLRGYWVESRVTGADTTTSMEESISNIVAVQSLGTQLRELNRFRDSSSRSFRGYLKGYSLIMVAWVVGSTLFGLLGFYALVVITNLIIDGVYTVGDLTVLVTFYFQILTGARILGGLWLTLQFPLAGMRRVFAVLDLPTEVQGTTATLPRTTRGIELRNVSFAYDDGRAVLRGINLSARKGQMIALAGPTGAGKTSLAYLLARFHEPTAGAILFDGHNIADYSVASVRQQVSFVFQETSLFDGTVLDNLLLAHPGASMADVIRATTVTGAHDFIQALPQRYDSYIGTTGSKLSVGQKQRISIARGLLKPSPILILDEPTSALDPETEYHLVQSLLDARGDQLVIVIAHRLSTIRTADCIYFLQDGVVTECGHHEELLAKRGIYHEFVKLQTSGPLKSDKHEQRVDYSP